MTIDAAANRKVWDLPLRAFHWLFASAIIGSIATAKIGIWTFHERCGLSILGLLVFRFIWGFYGSDTAKFSRFLRGPKAVICNIWGIITRNAASDKGHSAVGGWATMALLLVPTYMVSTGLFSTNGITFDGPLARFVSFKQAEAFADWHHGAEKILFLILFLHMAAIAVYYFWLKKNLIPAMIVADKNTVTDSGADQVSATPKLPASKQIIGLVLIISCILAAQSITLFV